jgi:hypothetical protein
MDFDKYLDSQRKQIEENNIDDIIGNAISLEEDKAIRKHGKFFNSEHEKYAVLLEEIEETREETLKIAKEIELLFKTIRKDEDADSHYSEISNYAYLAIKELIQVINVCNKGVKCR